MNQIVDTLVKRSQSDSSLLSLSTQLDNAIFLKDIILAALRLGLFFAIIIVEETLTDRAQPIEKNLVCPECGESLQSKGFISREMLSIIGLIRWRRRGWRCPRSCKIGQITPFDDKIGVKPNQKISDEVKQIACLLAIFMPYKIASMLIFTLTGTEVCPTSIWNWVQISGTKAISNLEQELKALSEGKLPSREMIEEKVSKLIMALGADGVMVPFRPNEGSPEGKAVWREVKIGIFVRLGEKLTKKGKKIKVTVHKRVVGVLGNIDAFKPRMWLMAIKTGLLDAEKVVWLSDGGTGFWGLFHEKFSRYAYGILDFYHAVQNVWKGARAWLDGRTKKAHEWFALARRKIRNGEVTSVIAEIKKEVSLQGVPDETLKILENLIVYLETHRDHMSYDKFKAMGFPIGSGMVESTCKWLIQQRFKGVGMRWSEKGFNNLLHLRLAWVNETFDELFVESFSPIQ
ncbi:MAG: ISKra4 family transposase [Pseudoalteromonas sp.]|nr:ISKra4 family transposase [Pseudoalteromonas sp.]